MFRPEVMLRELARLEPEIRNAAKAFVDNLTSDLDFYRLAEGPFAQAPKKSDRLCGDGTHRARRCAAGRVPLVRHR